MTTVETGYESDVIQTYIALVFSMQHITLMSASQKQTKCRLSRSEPDFDLFPLIPLIACSGRSEITTRRH